MISGELSKNLWALTIKKIIEKKERESVENTFMKKLFYKFENQFYMWQSFNMSIFIKILKNEKFYFVFCEKFNGFLPLMLLLVRS